MVEPGEPGVVLPILSLPGEHFVPSVDLASLMIFATGFLIYQVIDINKESLSLVSQLIHSWSASDIVVVW